ncbi:hypothetical protein SteCoe_19106 [Stentor coeruleus]|uniref:RING-type domain-containing protein n=1 Tax=Stentor coeruleus TaxID=5963 RepID=A0A1R2BV29_9CILI|nr:hypothetical protein SteCoe_19106 [Stentor coeruleus]
MCNSQCLWAMVNNTICDLQCYTDDCKFDGDDCDNYCYPGCTNEMINNVLCDIECNNEECQYDNFMCNCTSGCHSSLLYNDKCDDACNVKSCNYDNDQCKDERPIIRILRICGFVIAAIQLCLIILTIIWYCKMDCYTNDYRIMNVEERGILNLMEINKNIPETVCPVNLINKICAICFEEFKEEKMIRKLKCEHYFHSECIAQLLLNGHSSTCPLCNKSPFK